MSSNNDALEPEIEIETGMAIAVSGGDGEAIDRQIATAKRYPRTVSKSLREAVELATMDEDTAAGCFYSLPRKEKHIEGPSARLAEIMAYSWGNLRVEADVTGEDATHITATGTCFDLERNVAVRVRVKRRITNKYGKRYDTDMIGVTGNAAIAIALRNAVFKVIPRSYIDRVYQAARKASIGEGGTMQQKRQKAMSWFQKTGVQQDQVLALLGVAGLDDVTEDHLITLRGLSTAIRDGDTTVEQAFGRPDPAPTMADKAQAFLRQQAKKAKNAPEPLVDQQTGEITPPAPDPMAIVLAAEKEVGASPSAIKKVREELLGVKNGLDGRAMKAKWAELAAPENLDVYRSALGILVVEEATSAMGTGTGTSSGTVLL